MEPLAPGAVVDRYRLVAPLGEGGQGSVWRAEDPLTPGTPVALKLIALPHVSGADIDRLRREARALARLSHPSLPRCHAFFEDLRRDVIGFALDLIEGRPLSALLDPAALDRGQRHMVLRHLAGALRYIHEASLVHRDIKPQNVMIDRAFFARPEDPATVKLVDFGIAAAHANPAPLTAPGSVIGTVTYLAPELIDRGFFQGPLDGPERDVFAFGVLAYELFRGEHPTGLSASASMGDYLVAYRSLAARGAPFPEDVEGDPLAELYRRCLALRAPERAPHGGAALALLDKSYAAPLPAITPTSGLADARARGFRRATGVVLGLGALGFSASFFAMYTRPAATPLPGAGARGDGEAQVFANGEPPTAGSVDGKARFFDDGEPPPRAPSRPPARTIVSAQAAPTRPPEGTCPEGMVLVPGGVPFCIDAHEVTVLAYKECRACGPATEAYWPGASPEDLEERSRGCTQNRPEMEDKPVTCVKWFDANQYCASRSLRLPRMDELRRSRGVVSLCQGVAEVCPLFEWSADTLPGKVHPTRGPSFRFRDTFEGSNPESASNDDLGFRCATDPLPARPPP